MVCWWRAIETCENDPAVDVQHSRFSSRRSRTRCSLWQRRHWRRWRGFYDFLQESLHHVAPLGGTPPDPGRQEKSEMQAELSATMRRLEQPSLTVEAEPENARNTASPARRSSWILASELMTPVRPTTGGLRTPEGAPVRNGPSPVTQQYSRRGDPSAPPAQWGDRSLRTNEDEEGVDLFQGALHPGGEQARGPIEQDLLMEHQDKLNTASVPRPMQSQEQSHPSQVRCVDGRIICPQPAQENPPSTAYDSSTVSISTPGGVRLGGAHLHRLHHRVP